jgi:hypothetical protein
MRESGEALTVTEPALPRPGRDHCHIWCDLVRFRPQRRRCPRRNHRRRVWAELPWCRWPAATVLEPRVSEARPCALLEPSVGPLCTPPALRQIHTAFSRRPQVARRTAA